MLDQWLGDTPGEYFDWENTVLRMPLDPDLDVIGGSQNYDFWICVFFSAAAM